MLTRPQVMFLAGLLLLSICAGLTFLLRKAYRGLPLFTARQRQLRSPRGTLRLLRRCLFLKADTPELAALHGIAQSLTESLLQLRLDIRALPPLPGETEPRLMFPARQAAAEGEITAASLKRILCAWEADSITPAERLALPVCAAAAQCERLHTTLSTLLQDQHDRQSGTRLASLLARSKRPMDLLTQYRLSLTELATLLVRLRSQQQTVLLELIGDWLAGHGTDAEDIAERHARRQAAIAEDLHTASAHFTALRRMDWLSAAEDCDPLHRLLLNDPSGLYPHMAPRAHQLLRSRACLLARWFRMGQEAIVNAALHLSGIAEDRSLERHAGYYLLEGAGMSALRRQLATRRGRLRILMLSRKRLVRQVLLWCFSILSSILFLNDGHPLFMLPAFLVVIGCIPRAFINRWKTTDPPPAMEISAVTDELRTLVVLPATLADPSAALGMLHHLRTAQNAFPSGVDCLLIGDHPAAMTQRRSTDAAVIAAASQGTQALCGEADSGQFMYMQRSRIWLPLHRTYGARGGHAGAIETVCRLIAQGECEDYLDFSTISPASLHRRYAFVLVLDGDTLPVPGMLEALLSAASHPLNTRYPLPGGPRGFSSFAPVVSPGEQSGDRANAEGRIRLIRPDAYLEALDGQLAPEAEDDCGFLADALSGTQIVPAALAHHERTASLMHVTSEACRRAYHLCRIARWLLPWVHTPSGLVRNPLSGDARFSLRERMRTAALPLCRCILLLWSLLERNAALLLIALLLPEVAAIVTRGRIALWRSVHAFILLPLRAATSAYAAFRAFLPLLHRQEAPSLREPESWQGLELWAQGCAALLCFLLGVALPPVWPLALLPAAVYAMYPLLRLFEARRLVQAHVLPARDEPALRSMAEATWQFFRDALDHSPAGLPPAWQQFDPPVQLESQTTPESAGMYLMAVICAKELSFIDAHEAGERIASALDAITALPLRHGLPCREYALSSMTATDESIDARSCGILVVSLMTAAQALRTWLGELPSSLHGLPAALDEYVATLDIARLYDPSAGLFYLTLDRDGVGKEHACYHADVTLLLSMAASARRLVPPVHLRLLSRNRTVAGDDALPLSMEGDLASYLLPGLFLPLDAPTAHRVIWLQQKHGIDGLWGRSASAEYAFTPQLAYRRTVFGLRAIAYGNPSELPVFAAYAAALALPYAPEPALRCLRSMQQLGAFGPNGFHDAVDSSNGTPRVVHMQDAFHQALILCAAAHVLADAPLQAYFGALPPVEACLPLLKLPEGPPLCLPPRPIFMGKTDAAILPERTGDASSCPIDAHILGSEEASIVISAVGSGRMLSHGIPLTRFIGDPLAVEGLQCYIVAGGRVHRLMDAALPGEVTFCSGIIRILRHCGCLRAELTILTDPASGRFLHIVDVSNLSTQECRFEVADAMLPDMNATGDTLEASMPDEQQLVLYDRAGGCSLHHHIRSTIPPEGLYACTDSAAFLGRGRTLAAPASLEEPAADLPATARADCLSFRMKLTLGGRTQGRILFTTSLSDVPAPTWQELNALISVADLHAQAVAEAIPIPSSELLAASRLTGPLFWQGQPHQGAHSPLDASLAEPFLHARAPMLAVTVPDDASLPRLQECLRAAAWFALHGQPLTVYILCSARSQSMAEEAVAACMQPEDKAAYRILTDISPMLQEALFAASSLVIHGDGRSLTAQLAALGSPLPQYHAASLPLPGKLPDAALTNQGGYGGFDPDTGDYIIRLDTHQTTPAPWMIRQANKHFSFTADESGLRAPFDERLLIALDGGAPFDPLRSGLPMTVRIGAGVIRWRVYAADFTLTLDAAILDGHPASLRSVRIQSQRKEPMSAQLSVTASLAPGAMQYLDAVKDAVFSVGGQPGFLAAADGEWTAAVADAVTLPIRLAGSRIAELSVHLDIPPGLSAGIGWLCGISSASEDVAAAQDDVREYGVSACLRRAAACAVQRMPSLTVSTPETTLDLLINHVLPRQALSTDVPMLISALTSPEEAGMALIQTVKRCAPGSLRPALLTALHLHMTGDAAVLDMPIGDGSTLLQLCRSAILSRQPARNTAPLPSDQLCELFLAAAAGGELLRFIDDKPMQEHITGILNTADICFWHTDHYGAPDLLRLDVQACAALAFGHTPRIHKALRVCWETLYDRENGLIRLHLPTDVHACPGTVNNGGQHTASAVLFLAALSALGETDHAWELLRALNPLHHTDDPLRSEIYAGTPWLLPAGMDASPAAAGRAQGEDAAAASLLLTVTLTQLLGLSRRESRIVPDPHVPTDWDSFAVTMTVGASTWRIDMIRGLNAPVRDGVELTDLPPMLYDDGRIHQLRLPLK